MLLQAVLVVLAVLDYQVVFQVLLHFMLVVVGDMLTAQGQEAMVVEALMLERELQTRAAAAAEMVVLVLLLVATAAQAS
jgi:hypothetical protein